MFARVARVDGGKVDLSLRACRGGCEGKGVVPEKPPRGYKPLNPEARARAQPHPFFTNAVSWEKDPLEAPATLIAADFDSGKPLSRVAYQPLPQVKSYSQLQPGVEATGFVKATSKKGCFVTLGAGVDARVLLSNLSDTFVADPAKAFPPVRWRRGAGRGPVSQFNVPIAQSADGVGGKARGF